MSAADLELTLVREGDALVLASPEVGEFTEACPPGSALTPGQAAGVLVTLGVARTLRVPAGVAGLVQAPGPERVRQPVEFGAPLYRLAPLEGAGAAALAEDAAADEAGGLVLASPQSGRFYHRPAPGDPAFVEVGTELAAGQPVGLIEVMKTFATVPYRATGGLPERARVVALLAGDGDEVASGDPLLRVEPA